MTVESINTDTTDIFEDTIFTIENLTSLRTHSACNILYTYLTVHTQLPNTHRQYKRESNTINMSGLIVESTIRAAVHVGSSKIPSKIAKSSAALFTAFGGSKPSLPDLPYDYGALARTLLEPAL